VNRLHFNQKVKFSQKVKRLTQEQLVKVVQMIIDGSTGSLKEVCIVKRRWKLMRGIDRKR